MPRPITTVAIVCAKDEVTRIGRVLDVLVPILPTIVVDDGSTDNTSDVAYQKGASVLTLPRNIGKGGAMFLGMTAARNADIILFIDADLVGLKRDHIEHMANPVARGDYGMVVGMQDYGDAYNKLTSKLPLISGQRAIRRDILMHMPLRGWNGYGVETWINHIVARSGYPIGTVLLDGMIGTKKWEKDRAQNGTLGPGFANMVRMGENILDAHGQAATYPELAPMPISARANVQTSEDVMRALTRTAVQEGGPYVKEQLWTRDAQKNVGDAIGRRLAKPLWVVASCIAGIAFGPVTGLLTAISGLGLDLYADSRRKDFT